MASDLGGLRAKLGLDTSEVDAGLDRVGRGFDVSKESIRGYQKALLGLSFLLGSVSEGDNKSFKRLRLILSQSVTTITGTTFALQSLGGTFARFAGPVGIAVGALTGILSAMKQTNEEAKQEKLEKLKKYSELLRKIADSMVEMTAVQLADAKKAAREELEILEARAAIYQQVAQAMRDGLEVVAVEDEKFKKAGLSGADVYTMKYEDLQKAIEGVGKKQQEVRLRLASLGGVVPARRPQTPEEVEAERNKQIEANKKTEEEAINYLADVESRRQMEAYNTGLRNLEMLGALRKELADELLTDETERQIRAVEREFELRRDTLRAIGVDESEIGVARQVAELKIAEIRKKAAEETARREARERERSLDAMSDMVDLLQRALVNAGDSFVNRLLAALQVAIQIARALERASLKEGGAGLLDYLGVGSGVLGGLLGLFGFASGGYTGPGQRTQPAGVVHKGEYVFEKPLVDRYGPMISSIRDHLQRSALRGYAGGGMVAGSLPVLPGGKGLIKELRGLVAADRERPIQVHVHLRGTMSGQQFLQEEEPRYRNFLKWKQV